MSKEVVNSLIIIVTFAFAYYGRRALDMPYWDPTGHVAVSIYRYLWWVIPLTVVTGVLFEFKNVWSSLGLNGHFGKALFFGVMTTAPMFVGYAIIGSFSADLSVYSIFRSALLPGSMEELLFRGFLFGLLFRKLGWGFIAAALLEAIIFGGGHLYQGSTLMMSLSAFGVTFMGGLLYTWLYIEWDNNLWIPIWVHILMNLAWILFEVSETAVGGMGANIFRIATITLTILWTIRHRKNVGHFSINRSNLFWGKSSM